MSSKLDRIPLYLRKPIFEKLFDIAEYSKLTTEERDMYNTSLKQKWDNKAVLDYAVSEAIKEERAKAEAEKLKSALEFKKMGIPVADIAKGLGLTVEQVEKL